MEKWCMEVQILHALPLDGLLSSAQFSHHATRLRDQRENSTGVTPARSGMNADMHQPMLGTGKAPAR
jgi:hypothetical protein